MSRLPTFIFSIALGCIAHAQSKLAVVEVSKIYESLEAAKTLQAETEAERLKVHRDARFTAYTNVIKELRAIEIKIDAEIKAAKPEGDEILKNLQLTSSIKQKELRTLEREYEAFKQRRLRQINGNLVAKKKSLLSDIHRTAAKVAKKEGFDLLFDASGKSNSKVPFLLYSKETKDITSEVIQALDKVTTEPKVEISSDTSN